MHSPPVKEIALVLTNQPSLLQQNKPSTHKIPSPNKVSIFHMKSEDPKIESLAWTLR